MSKTMKQPLCPLCGEGHLRAEIEERTVEHKGHAGTIALHYSVCDVCGADQAHAADTRANKRSMLAFRKRVEGLLTGREIRLLRQRLELTQSQAAQLFGGGPVAFSKYENDDVMQSESMDKLLRLTSAHPEILGFLSAEIEQRTVSIEPELDPGPGQWVSMTFETSEYSFATVVDSIKPSSDEGVWKQAS